MRMSNSELDIYVHRYFLPRFFCSLSCYTVTKSHICKLVDPPEFTAHFLHPGPT